jgi:hypothetical protein
MKPVKRTKGQKGYLKFFPDLGYYAFKRRHLKGPVVFGCGGGDLATDTKRKLWYFTYDQPSGESPVYYGPFRSSQHARCCQTANKEIHDSNRQRRPT